MSHVSDPTPSDVRAVVAGYLQRKSKGEAEPFEAFLQSSGFAREVVQGLIEELAETRSEVAPARLQPIGHGETFGRFELRSLLGQGGMGTVYVAFDTQLGREVALKRIRRDLVTSHDVRVRFHHELKAVSRLDHPNICKVFEAGDVDHEPFFVMPRIEGESLTAKLTRAKTAGTGVFGGKPGADAWAVVAFVEKVARALAHAHERGLIHRDVKPSNILVTPDGEPMLVDFGLVRDEAGTQTVTRLGVTVGTCTYMSPEQLRPAGRVLDARTDVFSLGIVLWEMLTVEHPFGGKNETEVITSILAAEPRMAPQIAKLTTDLRFIANKALAKDRDKRYVTALALAEDLGRARRLEPVQELGKKPAHRLRMLLRRRRVTVAVVALLTLAFLTAAGFGMQTLKWDKVTEALGAFDASAGPVPELRGAVVLARAPNEALARAGMSRIWRALDQCGEAWVMRRQLSTLGQVIGRPALDHRGTIMACTASTGHVMVLDIATGSELKEWRAHEGSCQAAVFDPSGDRLFTCGVDGQVKTWRCSDWSQEASVPLTKAQVTGAYALAVSPAKRALAVGGDGGIVKLCRLETGEEKLLRLAGNKAVSRLEFSQTGKYLVALTEHARPSDVYGYSGFALIDTDIASVTWSYPATEDSLCHLAWDPSERFVVMTTNSGLVRVIDVRTRDTMYSASFSRSNSAVRWAGFDLSGQSLLVGADDGLVVLAFADGKVTGEKVVPNLQQGTMAQGAFSPNGNTFAAMLRDGSLCLYDPADWSLRGTFQVSAIPDVPVFATAVLSLAWASAAQRIVGGKHFAICAWFDDRRAMLTDYPHHRDEVSSVDVSRDKRWLLTSGADGKVRICAMDGSESRVAMQEAKPIRQARFSPSGAWFFVETGTSIRVLDASENASMPRREVVGTRAWACDASLLLVANGGEATMIDVTTMKGTKATTAHGAEILSAAYDTHSRRVFTGGADRRMAMWYLDNPQPTLSPVLDRVPGMPMFGRLTAMAFVPSSKTVWVGAVNNRLDVLLAEQQEAKPTRSLALDVMGGPIAVDPNGNFVLMADYTFGRVTWFDAKTFRPLRTSKENNLPEELNLGKPIKGVHTQTVTAVRFSPKGRFALTAAKDGVLHLWNPSTQEILRTIRNAGRVPFTDACFTPDGEWIVTGDASGLVKAWPVNPLPVAEEYLRTFDARR